MPVSSHSLTCVKLNMSPLVPSDVAAQRLEQWTEMKAYVGFGEDDCARLRSFAPHVERNVNPIVDNFYAKVQASPGAFSVLSGPEQIARLKQTLCRFIVEMFTGKYDEDYYNMRRRIGHVHVKVGLPERYVFTAMNVIRNDLCDLVLSVESGEQAHLLLKSIARITDLELAVMSSTYLEAHEERQLRTLQDLIVRNLPVTVLCLDGHGRVTSATRPSARLFSAQNVQGKHYEEYLPTALIDAADLPTHLGRALATGHEITIPRVVYGDGNDARLFRITLVPLNHELARVLLHIEELTDVVRSEQRLHQAEALARIGSLAAHLAHEIRNPLAAISATLQVIVGSLAQDDRRKVILDKVREQVHRLDRLVTDLLGYARPARAEVRVVDLQQLVDDAVSQAGVPVTVRFAQPVFVYADPQYLQQVLVNLFQNSRDALNEAGLPLQGRIRVVTDGRGAIIVEDDGPGIPSEVASRMFEPFVTSKIKGTGLGLAISQKLVSSMGGEMEWLSHRAGAAFRLSFRHPGDQSGVS